MVTDPVKVAIWPNHIWVSMEDKRDFEDHLVWLSDDYEIVEVTEWEEDGSPHSKYFK